MQATSTWDVPSQMPSEGSPFLLDAVQVLVDRAQAGDSEAFGQLYERLAPGIHRYLLRHTQGHRAAAEDLTAEVFVKALARLHTYEFRGLPFSAWLYRIAHNHLIDHWRTRPRDMPGPSGAADVADPVAERLLERALDRQALAGALARLPDHHRQVVALRFLRGCSIAETAAATGKTEDAVKKAQVRGLARLRRILEPTSMGDLGARA